MKLASEYLGLQLPHPIMAGASPMVDDLEIVLRLEDAGCAAIVMHSLFEEQILTDELNAYGSVERHADAHYEASQYLPDPSGYALGPDAYLEQISKIKTRVALPLIGSLNGVTVGRWVRYAGLIEQAGADALELNLYDVPVSMHGTSLELETRSLELVDAVRAEVSIPLAIKIAPFYTSLPHFASQLAEHGANGLVLFNRFFEPDLDIEELELERMALSHPGDLLLRLRWMGILSAHMPGTCFALSGGVHHVPGVVKAIMSGAHGVQVVSCLLRHGPEYVRTLVEGLEQWMDEHEYDLLDEMRGCLDFNRCPDSQDYTRVHYIETLMHGGGDYSANEINAL